MKQLGGMANRFSDTPEQARVRRLNNVQRQIERMTTHQPSGEAVAIARRDKQLAILREEEIQLLKG